MFVTTHLSLLLILVRLRMCLERHTCKPQWRPQSFTYDCIHYPNAFLTDRPTMDSGRNIWHKLLLESGECKCGPAQGELERRHAERENCLFDHFSLLVGLHVHVRVQNLPAEFVEPSEDSGMQRPQGLLQSVHHAPAFLIYCNFQEIITLRSMEIFKWPTINNQLIETQTIRCLMRLGDRRVFKQTVEAIQAIVGSKCWRFFKFFSVLPSTWRWLHSPSHSGIRCKFVFFQMVAGEDCTKTSLSPRVRIYFRREISQLRLICLPRRIAAIFRTFRFSIPTSSESWWRRLRATNRWTVTWANA